MIATEVVTALGLGVAYAGMQLNIAGVIDRAGLLYVLQAAVSFAAIPKVFAVHATWASEILSAALVGGPSRRAAHAT